jgi:hypothetical protein
MNDIAPITVAPSSALTLGSSAQGHALAEPAAADSLLNFVARAVKDPSIDVAKLEALLRLQREIVAADAELQFARAMSQCQGELQPVLRSMPNTATNSRYAPLDAIDAAIRPIYARHGFSLSFTEVPTEGATVRIACIVRCAGHTETYHLEAAADTVGPQGKPNKTPVQGVGSAVSYLRRYLTLMIFNVVMTNEDNDGNRPRAAAGRLTTGQLAELSDLMRQTRTEEIRFLAAMAPDLRSIEDAPAADFPRLKNALLTKKGVLKQRWRLAVQQEDAAKAAARKAAQ